VICSAKKRLEEDSPVRMKEALCATYLDTMETTRLKNSYKIPAKPALTANNPHL